MRHVTIIGTCLIAVLNQYDGQGVYCGLNTASEVFLIFSTQLY